MRAFLAESSRFSLPGRPALHLPSRLSSSRTIRCALHPLRASTAACSSHRHGGQESAARGRTVRRNPRAPAGPPIRAGRQALEVQRLSETALVQLIAEAALGDRSGCGSRARNVLSVPAWRALGEAPYVLGRPESWQRSRGSGAHGERCHGSIAGARTEGGGTPGAATIRVHMARVGPRGTRG